MSKNAGNIVLEAKNVVYYYKANKGKKVLDDISYGFEIGKMYAILGPSGSGKTTFLSLLAGLDSPTDGGIYYEGVNIRKKGLHNYRKKNMSLVFQNYNLIDYLTPEENVMLGGKFWKRLEYRGKTGNGRSYSYQEDSSSEWLLQEH